MHSFSISTMKTKHLNPVFLLFLQTTNAKPELLHNYKESSSWRYLLCLNYLLCQYKIFIRSSYMFLIIRIIKWPPKIITWGGITKYPPRGMLAALKRIVLYFLEKRDIMSHIFLVLMMWNGLFYEELVPCHWKCWKRSWVTIYQGF